MNNENINPAQLFENEKLERIAVYQEDKTWQAMSAQWLQRAFEQKYMYNFNHLGRPIIQNPQDMVALQEIIWNTRPDLIIETGIAHGGSLILSASMLAMLDYCDAVKSSTPLDTRSVRRKVIGIDIDIRPHNRSAIESHPMAHRIEMIEGSSVAPDIIARVYDMAKQFGSVMIILDSNHTHSHVLAELEAYAPLTTKGNYCIVFDTVVEDMPDALFPDRPWAKGNNPKTAVWEYMKLLSDEGRKALDGDNLFFEIDKNIENKLMITVAPDGYLKRTS